MSYFLVSTNCEHWSQYKNLISETLSEYGGQGEMNNSRIYDPKND